MEIKNLRANAIRSYEKLASSVPAKKDAEGGAVKNTDKVDFDFSTALASAKANVAASADAGVSAERISQLQAQYSGENCPVPSDAIAMAILGM